MKNRGQVWDKLKRIVLLQKDYYNQVRIASKNKDRLFFDALRAFLKSNDSQKVKFFEDVFGRKPMEKGSFVVGDIFKHRDKNSVSQHHGENFRKELHDPSKERVIQTNVLENSIIKDYLLSKDMSDTDIKKEVSASPMEENEFWVALYMLCIKPRLGKRMLRYELSKEGEVYILHVRLSPEKLFAVRISWNCTEWDYRARDFYYDGRWNKGSTFLFIYHEDKVI